MPTLTLLVNGTERKVEAQAGEPLLWVLRDGLGLTGTKYGCGEGQCGACTVLLDGKPVRSCRTAAESATGKKILTIESLAENGKLTPLQQAFLDAEAFQCGYCTPGMIMAGAALLAKNADPSEAEISAAMEGNICRCGTYRRIVRAIRLGAERSTPAQACGRCAARRGSRPVRRGRSRGAGALTGGSRTRRPSGTGCGCWPMGRLRSIAARPKWGRTSARRWRRPWPRSCGCLWSRCAW